MDGWQPDTNPPDPTLLQAILKTDFPFRQSRTLILFGADFGVGRAAETLDTTHSVRRCREGGREAATSTCAHM